MGSHRSKKKAGGIFLMKIAVTWENGNVFPHFGHTREFAIYQVEDGKILSKHVLDTDGAGHGALAGFLKAQGADVLLCGGIGPGAQQALKEAGICFYGGVTGSADAAAQAYLDGTLQYDPEAKCSNPEHHHGHHDHKEACGAHGCGGHGHEHSCCHHE